MTALAAACLLLCAGLNAVSGGETAFDRDFDFPWVTDPDKMAEEKVQFELYTRENLDMPEVVTMAELPVQLRYMDASRRTNIVVHGWGGPRWMRNLTNAFLTKEDLNVVVVNWSELDTFLYPVAAQRRKSVARQVGGFINFLVNTEEGPGLALSDLHLVGHSLGAHIAGMSSLHVDGTISRITGLDPASPLIPNDTDFRLDKTHAAFVDVIHTCGNVYGWRHPIGHADFYPNGGFAFQPGCVVEDLFTGKCSHNFAYSLFRESILLDGTFPALPSRLPLDSKSPCTLVDKDAEPVQMGLGAPHSARGVYCLATRPKAPFGFGPEVVLPSSNATVATEAQIAFMKIIFPLT